MSDHHKVTLIVDQYNCGKLLLDGKEIQCRAVNIMAEAGELVKVDIRIEAADVEVRLLAAQVAVEPNPNCQQCKGSGQVGEPFHEEPCDCTKTSRL